MKMSSLLVIVLVTLMALSALNAISVQPVHAGEYFFQTFYDPFDVDADGKNNAIKVTMDVDSTYSGTQTIRVVGILRDPNGKNCASNSSSWNITDAHYEYGEITLYVPQGSGQGLYDVIANLYDSANNLEQQQVANDIAYLYPPGVTIWAWDYEGGWQVPVPITKDGVATGYNTPHTFANFTGTHTFTVPAKNSANHPFSDWSTGWTDRTLTVSSPGVYTARYRAGYSVTIWAFAQGEGWMDWIPITKDGVATGYETPHTFANLTGTHTFKVPSNEPMGRVFYKWNTGSTSTTLTVSSAGTFTANYRWGTLTVTSPNGGEQWIRGTAHTFKWTSTGKSGANVKIDLMKGGVLNKVISSSTPNNGSYSWKIPLTQNLGSDYKIRITSTSHTMVNDSSNNNFAITSGTLTVKSPNGGEKWINGTTHTLTWTSAGSPGAYVKIELLKGGVLNKVITSSTPNNGSYSWKISSTQTLGTDYKIRITSTTYSYVTDSSNSNFAVVRGTITVVSPNGGEKWIRGTTHTITWSKAGTTGANVKIELLKNGVVNRIISSSTANDGSFSWTILSTQTLGTDYKIRITSTTYTSITDSSNNNFSITT